MSQKATAINSELNSSNAPAGGSSVIPINDNESSSSSTSGTQLDDQSHVEAPPLPSMTKAFLAEFIGTLIFIFIATGSVAVTVFFPELGPASPLMIATGFGVGLFLGISIASEISGGHLNPAVTIALALFKKVPAIRIPYYIVAQLLGAFCGALLTYLLYLGKFNNFNSGRKETTGEFATAGIFATYPDSDLSLFNRVLVEVVLSALFLISICHFTDSRRKDKAMYVPLAIGLTLGVIGLSFGKLTAFSLNPARDFGPRLFTLLFGWGTATFTAYSCYFWIPIVAPILGAILGAIIYRCTVFLK